MKEDTVVCVLRLAAVLTILVGAVLTTMTFIALIGTSRSMSAADQNVQIQVSGLVAEMGLFALLAHAAIAGWGFVLLAASQGIARRITA